MLLSRRYGRAGLLAFPYYFFLEMLGPVIEAVEYVTLAAAVLAGRADWLYVAALVAVAVVLGVALSVVVVALEDLSFRRYPRFFDFVRLLGLAVLENFGRPERSAWWRLKGTWSAIQKVEGWGRMEREGFPVVDAGGGGS